MPRYHVVSSYLCLWVIHQIYHWPQVTFFLLASTKLVSCYSPALGPPTLQESFHFDRATIMLLLSSLEWHQDVNNCNWPTKNIMQILKILSFFNYPSYGNSLHIQYMVSRQACVNNLSNFLSTKLPEYFYSPWLWFLLSQLFLDYELPYIFSDIRQTYLFLS